MSETLTAPGESDVKSMLLHYFDEPEAKAREVEVWLTVVPGRRPSTKVHTDEWLARRAYDIATDEGYHPGVRLYRQAVDADKNQIVWELVEESSLRLVDPCTPDEVELLNVDPELELRQSRGFVGWFYRGRLIVLLDRRFDAEGYARSLTFYMHHDISPAACKVVDLSKGRPFTSGLLREHLESHRITIENTKSEIRQLQESNDD